jgi:thiol-disulfide isomerase/thioredoxin
MKRMIERLACIALLTFATTAVAGAGADKPVSFSFKDLQGKKAKISDLRGKIVVVNFWATWCGPCDAEMPMLVQTAGTYAGKNVAFVGVSLDEPTTQNKIPDYLAKRHVEYPIWVGATDDDLKSLKLGKAVPATLFLDANGIAKSRILGQMRPGEIEQRVDWLLNGEQGTPPPAEVTHLDPK